MKKALCCCILTLVVLSTTVAEAASFKRGRFNANSVTGPQTFAHGLGEIPRAMIFWAGPDVGTAYLNYYFSFGVTDGTTSFCSGTASQDNVGASNVSRGMSNKAICIIQWGEATQAEASLTSWDGTNVTINWTTQTGNTGYYINYIAIGGSEVRAKVVNWQAPTVTGNAAVTGIGFKPDVVIHGFSGSAVTATPPVNQTNGHFGLGAMTAAGDQWATMIRTIDGAVPSDTNRGQQTDAAIYMFTTGGSVIKRASYVSMDTNGFTVNFTTTDAAASQIFSLALSGVSAKVGNFSKATAVGTQTVADVQFKPDVLMLTSFQSVAQAAPVSHARFGIGASDGTTEASTAFQDANGLGTTSSDQMAKTDKVFIKNDNNTQTVDAAADLTGFFNGGFTLDWTTNDAVATQMLYLALGQEAEAKVLTGSYRGDGAASHSINVGFVPDFVIVKGGDQTGMNADVGVFRSSTMGSTTSKPAMGLEGMTANLITSIDAAGGGGFTVGSHARVNSNACASGCLYYWTAFKAGSGKMTVGTYSGTGTSSPVKTITGLGFSPELVFILSEGATEALHVSSVSTMAKTFYDLEYASVAALGTDGFTVPTGSALTNGSGTTYHYVAWNAVPGEMVVATYAGEAAAPAGQNITSVGFESEYLFVHRQGAGYQGQARTASLAQSGVDGNLFFHVWGYGFGRISALLSNGFSVTDQPNINASGGTFSYYAWKRASEPMIATGDYDGSGVAQSIVGAGFAPDVVIVKQLTGGTERIGVIRTSTMTDGKRLTGATALLANSITSLDADGFTLGTSALVNSGTGCPTCPVHHFIAFKAAPGTMKVGRYQGNSGSNPILGMGFSPELVFIMSEGGNEAVHYSSASTAQFHNFANGAGITAAGAIALTEDGFTLSNNNNRLNLSGTWYDYIAWNEIPGQMDVGSYVGNSTGAGNNDNRSINSSTAATTAGLTFEPEYVIVQRDSQSAVHHTASIGRSTDSSLYFSATGNGVNANLIQALASDGFQVGDGATNLVNTNAQTYVYYAWKRPVPVSVGTLTAVRLIAFDATRYDRGVLLQWRTGHEVDNLGFHVYREVHGQRTRVTRSMVAGSGLMAGQGSAVTAEKRYATWDSERTVDSSAVYWLQDLDFNGTSTWHGPVTPVEGGLKAPPNVPSSAALGDLGKGPERGKVFVESGGGLEPRGKAGAPAPLVSATENQWALAAQGAVKIGVDHPGWYRVTQPELVAAGLSPRVDARTLRLFVDGVEQAMVVTGDLDSRFDPVDAIEFYGAGVDTPYTDTRVYWLVADSLPGLRMVHGPAVFRGPPIDPQSFDFTVQQKERSIYFASLRNGEEENWFGSLVSEEPVDLVFDLSNVDATAPDAVAIEIALQGVTNNPAAYPDHRVAVLVNGTEIGELSFDGQSLGIQSFAVPPGILGEGANTVTMVAREGETDISLVDVVRLRYAHTYRADADLLRFTAEGPAAITVRGFASSGVRVIDITDPLAAEEVGGKVFQDGRSSAVLVGVPEGPRTLLAFTDATIAAPAFVRANRPSRWHEDANGTDYLAVVHAEFAGAVGPLLERREQQGLSTARIDIEDVYDEFSFGEKTPQALKDFMKHGIANWKRLPRFMLLIGDATIDPRDYADFGDADFVPTKQVSMDHVVLETASDDWFVDVDDDGLPDVAIGRLPVRTLDQAQAIIAKTIGYEELGDVPWFKDVLFVADNDEAQVTSPFDTQSRALETLLPDGYHPHELFASELTADALRQALASQVADGRLIVNYSGHGSTHLWGVHGDLLNPDEVNTWTNSRLPFVVAMNCLNGAFYGIYDEESLAETLLRLPQGGAVAVWASSGVTDTNTQAVVAQELYRLIFQGTSLTMGEVALAAKRVVSNRDVQRFWVFFGDPAMRLNGVPYEPPPDVHQSPGPPPGGTSARDAGSEDRSSENLLQDREHDSAPLRRLADFDGDGVDDLFWFSRASGEWRVTLSRKGLSRSGQWSPGLEPFAADFDGNGVSDLFLYDRDTGVWFQALNTGGAEFTFQSGTWLQDGGVSAGDFNGDGREDVLLYQPATGQWLQGLSDGAGGFTYRGEKWATQLEVRLADFNGDRRTDVLTYNRGSGEWSLATSAADGSFSTTSGLWKAGQVAVPANLNNDARADLMFHNTVTGQLTACVTAAAGLSACVTVGSGPDLVVGVADLSGDGRDDLLVYNPGTGEWTTRVETVQGSIIVNTGTWAPHMEIMTGDLNGDGRADVWLHEITSGRWIFAAAQPGGDFAEQAGTSPAGWSLAGRP